MTTKLKIRIIQGEWAHKCHNSWYDIQREGEMTNGLDCNKAFTYPLPTQTTNLRVTVLYSYIAQ